jgi:shikimate kinase
MLHGRTRAEAEALYEARKPFYAKADLAVDTTTLTPDQIAARVAAAIAERQRQAV